MLSLDISAQTNMVLNPSFEEKICFEFGGNGSGSASGGYYVKSFVSGELTESLNLIRSPIGECHTRFSNRHISNYDLNYLAMPSHGQETASFVTLLDSIPFRYKIAGCMKLSAPLMEGQLYAFGMNVAALSCSRYFTDNMRVWALTHDEAEEFRLSRTPESFDPFDRRTRLISYDDNILERIVWANEANQFIDNITEWRHVSSCYVGQGGEEFICIESGTATAGYEYLIENPLFFANIDPCDRTSTNGRIFYNAIEYQLDEINLFDFGVSVLSDTMAVVMCDDATEQQVEQVLVEHLPVLAMDGTMRWTDGIRGIGRSFAEPGLYSGIYSVSCDVDILDIPIHIRVDTIGCRPQLYIPNAFSPNNDGINDLYTIYGYNIEVERFSIYDRYGGKLYEAVGRLPEWDGSTYDGTMVPDGSYTYQAILRSKGGHQHLYSGELLIMR